MLHLACCASQLTPDRQVLFEPASLPSTALSCLSSQTWEGDLLVIAVTEEDLAVEGEGEGRGGGNFVDPTRYETAHTRCEYCGPLTCQVNPSVLHRAPSRPWMRILDPPSLPSSRRAALKANRWEHHRLRQRVPLKGNGRLSPHCHRP